MRDGRYRYPRANHRCLPFPLRPRCFPDGRGRPRIIVRQMPNATTYARLKYGAHAMITAHRCASARVDSRDPMVDSGLIAGQAGTAPATRGSVGELALPRDRRCTNPCRGQVPLCAVSGRGAAPCAMAAMLVSTGSRSVSWLRARSGPRWMIHCDRESPGTDRNRDHGPDARLQEGRVSSGLTAF